MDRYLKEEITLSVQKKLILITGPRQVGKTYLSKSINDSNEYLNFDNISHKKNIISQVWDRNKKIIILDEIHKMKNWKRWLKGTYDTEKNKQIIVTGSAKMDTHRKVGDSLAGRYFQYQLFPLDLKELKQNKYKSSTENFEQLINLSGFPEPFLAESKSFYHKWQKTHLDVIIKQDIVELETIKRVADLAILIELMKERVGSMISHNSLKEDLQTDDKSIKRWLNVLENAYILFKITPYSLKIINTLKKQPKYYFYDYPRIAETGARLENFVALSLLKEISFRNEVNGENYSLHYLRNTQKEEIDFLICKDRLPHLMIEVKQSDDTPAKAFKTFTKYLVKQNAKVKMIQLVLNLKKEFQTKEGIHVCNLVSWLERMDF